MESVKSYTYKKLINKLLGNIVHFTSECELFPNFDINGKVISYYINNNELILKVKNQNYKIIDIGTNMHKLKFEIIKRGDLH